MKQCLALILFALAGHSLNAQQVARISAVPDSTKKIQVVEAACGLCQFGLKSTECSLAIRINGHAYFVDGTSIDDHGDAHAKDGFCNAIRKADVQGEIVKGRFKATYFRLQNKEAKLVTH